MYGAFTKMHHMVQLETSLVDPLETYLVCEDLLVKLEDPPVVQQYVYCLIHYISQSCFNSTLTSAQICVLICASIYLSLCGLV